MDEIDIFDGGEDDHLQQRPSQQFSLAGAAIFVGVIGVSLAAEFGPPLVGCAIKGNISISTGQRIYHVPDQEYYWGTHIDWLKGERWFCSEEDARSAGWRRATR